jgi:hypothetical protein
MSALYDDLANLAATARGGIARYRTGAGTGSSVHILRDGDDMIASVRSNVILRVTPEGRLSLSSCGWHTRTTSMAWNICLRATVGQVYSNRWRYYLRRYGDMGTDIPFEDVGDRASGHLVREVLTLEDA